MQLHAVGVEMMIRAKKECNTPIGSGAKSNSHTKLRGSCLGDDSGIGSRVLLTSLYEISNITLLCQGNGQRGKALTSRQVRESEQALRSSHGVPASSSSQRPQM